MRWHREFQAFADLGKLAQGSLQEHFTAQQINRIIPVCLNHHQLFASLWAVGRHGEQFSCIRSQPE